METFVQFDLVPMLLGALSALVCGLLGNFLVLRRQALMGDAISHVVLPGIVFGFLVSGTTASLPMLFGAGAAALAAVGLIELIRRLSRIESGAVMGVVFTFMFALGVVLLEQSDARSVHIDVQHSLYGNLQNAIWLGASDLSSLFDPAALATLPEALIRLLVVTGIVVLFVIAFYKELKIVSFDAGLADSLGISSRAVGFGLVAMTALAAVASFSAVGSILVIAMFICPPATARLLTDRLSVQIWLSALFAVVAGVAGYLLAAFGPMWLGFGSSVSAAGMIAVVSGLILIAAIVAAPRYGIVARRQGRLA
jgi:manganese/zinc/iron transport system permease protein